MTITGWKALSSFTGLSTPVLNTCVKLRGFPQPSTVVIKSPGQIGNGRRRNSVWNQLEVTEWLKQHGVKRGESKN